MQWWRRSAHRHPPFIVVLCIYGSHVQPGKRIKCLYKTRTFFVRFRASSTQQSDISLQSAEKALKIKAFSEAVLSHCKYGANGGDWTHDLLITNQLHYHCATLAKHCYDTVTMLWYYTTPYRILQVFFWIFENIPENPVEILRKVTSRIFPRKARTHFYSRRRFRGEFRHRSWICSLYSDT